ncbi:MAG: membrane protein insertion efficiency factor YidD [Polyangiaceae bacterium]
MSAVLTEQRDPGIIARVLLALIRIYQLTLSRLIGPVCRFEPSCSRYSAACISSHGALRGSLLSVRRLCKCHPFHPGGFDPPPPPKNARRERA